MEGAHIVMETALAGIRAITAEAKAHIGCDDSTDSAYCSGCWAAGLDLNYVRQRDFEGRFGFQDYEVATGHLSLYYTTPIHDVLAAIHVGRYLAKDKGITFDLSRTFDNGFIFGVFATRTDVSSAEFGEGSFDKGFYLSVPLDLFSVNYSRRRAGVLYRPLTRDGGARLGIPRPLYGVTEAYDYRFVNQGWSQILD